MFDFKNLFNNKLKLGLENHKMNELIDYYDVTENNNIISNNEVSEILKYSNNSESNNIDNILQSIKYCPEIDDSIIKDLKEIFEKCRKKKKKRALLGVIKFIHEGNEYIHCPIKKVKDNGNNVKFGVCKHLDSLLNTKENRKKLSIHKFQFHYLSKPPDVDNVNLYLKTQNSVEEIIVKMKNNLKINSIEINNEKNVNSFFKCKSCGKKNKKICCLKCIFCGNYEI